MKRLALLVLVIAGAGAAWLYSERAGEPSVSDSEGGDAPTVEQAPQARAHLLDGLGGHPFPITSNHPDVQRWFDQGLMLAYGFNHDAAERTFVHATELDRDCAMCWWGAALVLGPHVNAGMDPGNNEMAWERLKMAQANAAKASPREQAFIRALGARYSAQPPDDRRQLDIAYADAMAAVVEEFPDDLDAATLHAEALMDLQPWDYYDDQQQPKGRTSEIVAELESVMARNPDHPGALHLYVHAVEASSDPERGVDAADRLRTLVPGSGHLVHMPAHIYSRVGRWHDAMVANRAAIESDDRYLAICGGNVSGIYPLGYVPHNHHFLWFAASMAGASAEANAAALETAARTDLQELMRQPGFAGLQHYWLTPWFDRVRFGRWDEIVGKANPAPDLPYVTAIWNYAQGMAALRQQRLDDARKHAAALSALARDPAMDELLVWERYPLSLAARIASLTLAGELAAADGDADAALAALREAVRIEDGIPYDEPPGWHAPARHTLGALLLQGGQAAEAESVYRAELARNPGNGWSLFGLAESLRAQKRDEEAAEAQHAFEAAWQHADVKLASSRM